MFAAAVVGAANLSALAQPVSVYATWTHPAAKPYRSVLSGRVTLAVDKSPPSRLTFRLGLGEKTCRLAITLEGQAVSGPFEACLTRADIDEAQFSFF